MFRLKGFTSFQLRKEYPHLKKYLLFGLEVIFVVRLATLQKRLLKNIFRIKILEGGSHPQRLSRSGWARASAVKFCQISESAVETAA